MLPVLARTDIKFRVHMHLSFITFDLHPIDHYIVRLSDIDWQAISNYVYLTCGQLLHYISYNSALWIMKLTKLFTNHLPPLLENVGGRVKRGLTAIKEIYQI